MATTHTEGSAAAEVVPDLTDPALVAEELRQGPRGALFLATVAVLLLLAGWLAFYFFLFLPRGSVG